jgi:hypothetical protein
MIQDKHTKEAKDRVKKARWGHGLSECIRGEPKEAPRG